MNKLVKKLMLADPDKNILLYQFTTAFPVGLDEHDPVEGWMNRTTPWRAG